MPDKFLPPPEAGVSTQMPGSPAKGRILGSYFAFAPGDRRFNKNAEVSGKMPETWQL